MRGSSSRPCWLCSLGLIFFLYLLLDVANPFLGGVFTFEMDENDDAVHRVGSRVAIARPPELPVVPATTPFDTSSPFVRPLARSICDAVLLTVCLGHRDRGGAEATPSPEDAPASLLTLA